MELIFIFAKFLEYTVFVPVWWVATYLAAFFYPVEHDPKQDYLGWIFSFFIIMGLLFGVSYAFRSPEEHRAVATDKPAPDADVANLNAELATLKSAPGLSAIMPTEPEKAETH